MSNYNDLVEGEEYIITVEEEDGTEKDRIAVLYDFSDGIEGADQFTPKYYQFAFDFSWVGDREFECDWIEVGSENLKSWKRVSEMSNRRELVPFLTNLQTVTSYRK